MGGGAGPLNVALESLITERVGVLSQTSTDPGQFLNFFRFSTCYEVVPLIQHPVLGPPPQAISTALHTKSRVRGDYAFLSMIVKSYNIGVSVRMCIHFLASLRR